MRQTRPLNIFAAVISIALVLQFATATEIASLVEFADSYALAVSSRIYRNRSKLSAKKHSSTPLCPT
jgi:hypothetical protein